ncbi:signal transduction histidine kinase [Natranaerovirga pectinivora]|uniref:histidine kinase n=1 Tax=Natranaerovirga pectinivora TaxID=682400 RepID=A0A4R3MM93_9FIRM|nr:histidine kinase [Natranaerovirga pectinivora]TCT16045.1 signal transduction histidine kinase [Natranaerovirga pectinivora]
MIIKQWHRIYLFSKINMILIFGFLSIIFNINQSTMIFTLIGVMLILCCSHELLTDGDSIKEDKKEWVLNSIFLFTEIVIGILTFLILEDWYNAMFIYILVSPSYQWIKKIRIFLPSVCYLSYSIFFTLTSALDIKTVSYTFLLLFLCLVLYYIEKLVCLYEIKETQILKSVKQSVLNELLAKNISKELTEKVYLVEENARYEERENIARNMHNAVGHTITSAIMALNATKVIYDMNPSLAKEKISVAEDRMHKSLNEIRQAVRILDKEINELSIKELSNMLKITCEQFMLDTEIQIVYKFYDALEDVYINNRHCEFLHSSLSEALTNGVRHGNATRFYVEMIYDSRHVKLIVKDNGTIFNQFPLEEQQIRLENGYGLKKIQNYITRCGGNTKLDFQEGFQITMELPIISSEKRWE